MSRRRNRSCLASLDCCAESIELPVEESAKNKKKISFTKQETADFDDSCEN